MTISDDTAARLNQFKTYMYLRIGMLFVIALLAVSVIRERFADDHWQTSISAYFHTPARSIFVGALVAIGACLVVIRGYDDLEDILLNVAGMLAPVVAFVPIDPGGITSSTPRPADEVFTGAVANNIVALVAIGTLGVAAATVFVATSWGALTSGWRGSRALRVLAVVVALGIVAGTYTWYRVDIDTFGGKGRITGHYTAAVLLFLCIMAVVLLNGRTSSRLAEGVSRSQKFRFAYIVIGTSMVVVAIAFLIAKFGLEWRYAVLWVEILLIALFATFWTVQTIELTRRRGAFLTTVAPATPT